MRGSITYHQPLKKATSTSSSRKNLVYLKDGNFKTGISGVNFTNKLQSAYTVKLGYNDHGYNELTVIAHKFNLLVWFSIFSQ